MAVITFRCSSCNQGLKVGADKVGRRIKCSKCGTALTIPAANAEESKKDSVTGPAPPPPVKDMVEEETDDKKGYGFLVAPGTEEKKVETKTKKEEKKAPPPERKFKSLPDPELWEKVKTGLQIMMVSGYFWAGAVGCTTIMVILGIVNGPEYAEVLENAMTVRTPTPAGEFLRPDMPAFFLGLVTGVGYQGIGKTLYIVAALLSLLQIVVLLAGCAVCLKIPNRFGTQGQLKALLAVCGLNFVVILVFKLLPALGVANYILVPYALPEVSLIDANMDRDPAIWIAWGGAPFWEMLLNVVLLCLFYAQPIFIGIFLWSIGMTLKEDPISGKGQGLVALGFGIAFTLLAFHLLSMTGTSGVALIVLRILYAGWIGFTILLLLRVPVALQAGRTMLQKYLDGAVLEEDDDDDGETKPKRKRKAARDEEEDE